MTPTSSAAPKSRRARGTTLAELIVAMFVMTIVLFASYDVLSQGYSYFKSNENALDAQRSSLTFMTELAADMENSNTAYVVNDSMGVSFLSPVGADGQIQVNQQGQLYYQDIICYYLASDHNIYRKNQFLPTEIADDPSVASTLSGLAISHGASNYFSTTNVPGVRMVATNIDQLYILALGASVGAVDGSTQQMVNVTLYAGDPSIAQSTGYYVTVSSSIFPRNKTTSGATGATGTT